MNFKLKAESLKFKDQEFLEQYLEGKAPLHADRLNVPSDEELEEAEAEFDRMVAGRQQPARRITLWLWAVGIAAATILVFMLWPKVDTEDAAPLATNEIPKVQEYEQEEQPLIAQLAEPKHPAAIKKTRCSHVQTKVETPLKENIDVNEPLEEKIAGLTIVPTSADLGPGVHLRLGTPCPQPVGVEPLPEEQQPSPIPPDKQALADIYLAEMALQVAYEQRAVQEAVRAYAASITGEEIPQPIIAF